jgi:hypothetical protein
MYFGYADLSVAPLKFNVVARTACDGWPVDIQKKFLRVIDFRTKI